jgi:predicted ATPase
VGRESTLDKLTNAINGLSAGGLILISGEPGVGKSRLVQSFALSSKRLVLTGNSHLATHSTPYQPLTQALRQALQHPDLWKGMRSIWLAEVSRLLPELKETFPDLPKPVDIASDQAQARLFTGITHIFEKLSLSSPLLLCLDDLHWADMATLNWLINVSTHRVNSPFIILATCRSEDITALADVHQAFRRMNRLVDIEISGLNEKAIAKILRMVELPELSEEIEPLTTRLVQATGGNTFFLLETIRLIQENEHTSVPQGSLPLSATVKEAIHRRLQKITPLGHQTLQAAAVLAPFIQPNFIKITSGRDDLELADALDELNSRQLLQPAGNGFEFSHELLRMVVYESLTPWRRLILHRRAAEAISSQSGQEELPLLTAIAKHFDSAGAYREAIRAYQRAATSAAAVYAYEEAIGHLKQACALLPEAEIEHDNYEFLHENLGKNLARLAKFQPARASFRDALNCIKPEDLLGRTRLHHQIANTYLKQLHYDKAEYHLQQAQSDLDNYEGKTEETWLQLWIDVQLNYQYLCFCLIKIERLDKLEPELAPVVSQFGRGDQQRRFAEQSILTTLHKEQYRPSEETLALIQSQLDSAISSGQPEYITISRFDLGSNLLHAGQLDLAEPLLLGALSGAEQICLNMVAARCLAFLVTLYRLKGDPERTAEFVDRAAEASQAVGSHHFYAHSLACQSWLNYRKGNWDRALPLAEKADNLFVKSNVPWTWLAKVLVMAIYSNTDRLSAAVESAHGMLAPGQQRLPAGLAQPLQEAVTYWKEGDAMATRRELQNSILAAKLIGYL